MEKLSVLVPTYNNESIIRDCLESIKWADEILVCDSYSTDSTLDIAQEYGARIIQHEYINSARQKNWAIPQCRFEWVFAIDTDEQLEPGLAEEIQEILRDPPSDIHAYCVPRKNFVFGVWLKTAHFYPDYQIRLFRRDLARFEDREVHAHVLVPGKVGSLTRHVIHHDLVSVSKWLCNLDRYTRYEADELVKRGRRFHWTQVAIRPVLIFLWSYILRSGFRSGFRGFFVSAYAALYTFLAYAKLWEKDWQAGERQ